jgi:hypothetical protein
VLAAYAEPLVEGRRVLVVGNAASGLAEHLLDRGARLVAVFDPDPARAAEVATRAPSSNASFAPLADGAWALRDAAFDCAIVEDLGATDEAASLLRRVRRALAPRGAALVSCANPEVRARLLPGAFPAGTRIDYYRLYDLMSEQFELVKMLGQAPFVGYAVVAFSPEGDPEPAIDTGFLPAGGEEPEHFIALGSSLPVKLEEFAVVELPARNVLASSGARGDDLALARSNEQRVREQLAKAEAENAKLEQTLRERGVLEAPAKEVGALREELEKRDVWLSQLEARAATADARADTAEEELDAERAQKEKVEQQLGDAHARAAKLEQQLAEARGRVARLEERIAEHDARAGDARRLLAEGEARGANLERQAAANGARLAQLEQQLSERDSARAALEQRLREAEEKLAALAALEQVETADEVGLLESQLRTSGAEVRRLQRNLAEAERIGRELVEELDGARAALTEAAERAVAVEPSPAAVSVESAPSLTLSPVAADGDGAGRAELVAKLNHLAQLNAEQEADLLASRWRVAELEGRLEETEARGDRDLAHAQSELAHRMALIAQIRAR